MIWIQNQLVGAMEGQQITLECHSEAYPRSINYWTMEDGNIISEGNISRVDDRNLLLTIDDSLLMEEILIFFST